MGHKERRHQYKGKQKANCPPPERLINDLLDVTGGGYGLSKYDNTKKSKDDLIGKSRKTANTDKQHKYQITEDAQPDQGLTQIIADPAKDMSQPASPVKIP